MPTARITFDSEIVKDHNPALWETDLVTLRDSLTAQVRKLGVATAADTIDRLCGQIMIGHVIEETAAVTGILPTIVEVGPDRREAAIYAVLRFQSDEELERFVAVLPDRI